MTAPQLIRRAFLGATVLTGVALLGCARLNTDRKVPDLADTGGPQPGYFVQFEGSDPQAKPITGTVFLQQALEEAGAFNVAGDPNVTVLRSPAPGQPPIKMAVRMKDGRVAFETDYAIHPGDQIVVKRPSPASRLRSHLRGR